MSDPIPPSSPASLPEGGCAWWELDAPGLTDTARKRRDEIMDAAEAIIAGYGIDKLSLSQIESRANMSRGQLTYYFPTRESILLAVYDRILRRMIRAFLAEEGPKPMTGRAWDCFGHALGKHLEPTAVGKGKELFSLLFTFLAQMSHRSDYRTKLAEIYRGWREHIAADVAHSVPEPRPVSPKVTASIVQALLQGLEIQMMIDPDAFDRTEMLAACQQLLAPAFKQGELDTNQKPDEAA